MRFEYRVEALPWDGHDEGARHLEEQLNRFADDGWEVFSLVPTTAGTSIRSLVSANASADTTELAVVMRRTVEDQDDGGLDGAPGPREHRQR
jgi:hypothetical protein